MSEFIFLDGKVIDKSFLPRALFYGEGVFETFRWKGKPPVFLEKHFERLSSGAKLFDIPFPEITLLFERIYEAVKKSRIHDAYVKLCLIAEGETSFYKMPQKSSILVLVKKHTAPKEEFSLCVSKLKRNQFSPLHMVKSFNYMENILSKREALDKQFDDAIFLNINDEIVETSSCNIFWVRGKALFTPSINCGLLPGITRNAVLSIAPDLGYEINERKFKLPYLLNSDFAFLTNASAGVIYVNKINNQVMPKINAHYKQLKDSLTQKLDW
ncbi:MAG: aminotransferase class IV [Thermodesulfobacteriota bacterium]